jgi:hypothetical protein
MLSAKESSMHLRRNYFCSNWLSIYPRFQFLNLPSFCLLISRFLSHWHIACPSAHSFLDHALWPWRECHFHILFSFLNFFFGSLILTITGSFLFLLNSFVEAIGNPKVRLTAPRDASKPADIGSL